MVSGVATGLLGLIIPLFILRRHDDPLLAFLWFILPALLVAGGAYLDAARGIHWGRILLWVLVTYYALTHSIFFIMAGKWGTLRGALPIFILPVMSVITLAFSLSHRRGSRLA